MNKYKINNITISEAITHIKNEEYVLPDFQRKFVWDEKRIIKLFDSLMRDYPYGTLVFWLINDKNKNTSFTFYKFINHFNYNEHKEIDGDETIKYSDGSLSIVLDGQQRLTSFNIGVRGYIETHKKKYKHNEFAIIKKFLFFNSDYDFQLKNNDNGKSFEFLQPGDIKEGYVEVSKIFGYNSLDNLKRSDIYLYKTTKQKKNIECLWRKLHNKQLISYYEIENDNIDDVLESFVRLNTQGKSLNKSQLFFSIMVRQWPEGREKFDRILDVFNKKYNLNIETLMNMCLYIVSDKDDTKEIGNAESLTLSRLDDKSIELIKKEWERIQNSIEKLIKVLDEIKMHRNYLISINSLFPVLYYLYKQKCITTELDIVEIKKYIYFTQIMNVFGGTNLDFLYKIRKMINLKNTFLYKNFETVDHNNKERFFINEQRVKYKLDQFKKSDVSTKILFYFLDIWNNNISYTGFDDLDHLHPKKEYNKLINEADEISKKELIKQRDNICNLQLIYHRENINKSSKTLIDWINNGNEISYDPVKKLNKDKDFYSYERRKWFFNNRKNIICKKILDIYNYELK